MVVGCRRQKGGFSTGKIVVDDEVRNRRIGGLKLDSEGGPKVEGSRFPV